MSDRAWGAVPFRNTWDREVRQREMSWDQLVSVLTSFRVSSDGTKKDLPAWSPTVYRPDTTRGKANVEALSCLVLDYDGGTTIEEALAAWSWRRGILHTSWSHTEDLHKFRVILPLERPVDAADWEGVYHWADRYTRRLLNPEDVERLEDYPGKAKWESVIDTQCKDAGRIYYLPALREEGAPHYAAAWVAGDELPDFYLGQYTPWARQVEALRAKREAAKRPPAPPTIIHKAAVRDRERANRLRHDPGTRERLGVALGGRVVGDAVRGVRCPRCSRSDVWWLIQPDQKKSASCNHGNSCGWYGSLNELAAMAAGGQ